MIRERLFQAVNIPAFRLMACLALCLNFALPAQAKTLAFDIVGPARGALKITLAQPLGSGGGGAPPKGAELQKILLYNLSFLPFLEIIPGDHVLGGDRLQDYKGAGIDFKRFQLAGSDLLVTAGWPGPNAVELRAFEVFTNRQIIGKAYSDLTDRMLTEAADRFCEELMEKLTGRGDFFRSTLAFVRPSGQGKPKNVFTVSPLGRNLNQATSLEGYALSPAWSPDASKIAFSHIDDRYHTLRILNRATGKVQRVKFAGNTVIGPAFTRDGRVAVSLANGGYPDIFLLNRAMKPERALVQGPGIDVSPSFDQNGRKMAFVSNRYGNPHIFLLNMAGGGVQRVTFEGSYNTDPSISPDGKLIAFCRRTGDGHRIFMHDLETGMERQLSFGPGSDEQPAFAPDGYFVAFTSTRAGGKKIFLTTRHGDKAIEIPTGGGASFPAWGVTKKR